MNKLDNEKLISLVIYKLKDTLFNLMYDICENPVDDVDNPPQFLLDYENSVRKLYTEIEDNLDLEIDQRKAFTSELDVLLDTITKKAVDINKYICYNNQLGEYVLREMKLIEVSNVGDNIPFNNGAMAENINHYLSHLKDDIEGKYAKGELISTLPLRMTKAKYRDYIKSAFNIMASELPKEFAAASMERLKDMCYTNAENINNDFPLMAESIEEIYKLPVSEFSRDNVEEYFNLIDDNIHQLTNIYTCLGVMYDDIIYMKLLCDFAIDSDFMFEDDFVLKDLYHSVCNIINENDDTMLDTVLENLSNTIEERFEQSKKLEAEISSQLDKLENTDELDIELQTAINVNNAISSAYMLDIDQQIMLSGNRELSVDELADELCDYIEKSVEPMENVKQKYIKQKFLKNLPSPMTDNQFMDYTRYSLDGVSDRKIMLMSYADIFDIIDKVEEEHHHEHHHHHDEHCNCGHHH